MIAGQLSPPKPIDLGTRLDGRSPDRQRSETPREGFGAVLDRSGPAEATPLGERPDRAGRAHAEAPDHAQDASGVRRGSGDDAGQSPATRDASQESEINHDDSPAPDDRADAGPDADTEANANDPSTRDADEPDAPASEDETEAPADEDAEPDTTSAANDRAEAAAATLAPRGAPFDASRAETPGDRPRDARQGTDQEVADPRNARTRARPVHIQGASRSGASASTEADTGTKPASPGRSAPAGKGATEVDPVHANAGSPASSRIQTQPTPDGAQRPGAPAGPSPGAPAGGASTPDADTGPNPEHGSGDARRERNAERTDGAQPVRDAGAKSAPTRPSGEPDAIFRLVQTPVTPGDLASAPGVRDGSGAMPGDASARPNTSGATPTDRAFVSGLSRGLSAALNQKGGSLTMKLTPPTLGEVRIVMTLDAGRVSVELQAGGARAHELLNANLPALRATLEGRGLTVERLGTHLSTTGTLSPGATHAQSGNAGSEQGGQANGRPEDSGADHDASGGRSRGYRERGEQDTDGRRGGDDTIGAFEELFGDDGGGGAAGENDDGVRLGLDAVI